MGHIECQRLSCVVRLSLSLGVSRAVPSFRLSACSSLGLAAACGSERRARFCRAPTQHFRGDTSFCFCGMPRRAACRQSTARRPRGAGSKFVAPQRARHQERQTVSAERRRVEREHHAMEPSTKLLVRHKVVPEGLTSTTGFEQWSSRCTLLPVQRMAGSIFC